MDEDVSSIETVRTPMNKRKPLKLFILLGIPMILIGGAVLYLFVVRDSSPIPNHILSSVSYPVYFPDPAPSNYMIQKSTVNYSNGVVSYDFQHTPDGTGILYVNEQALPPNPPDLQKLVDLLGFKKVDVAVGTAVLGQNEGKTTAILLTNTTLVTISDSKDIPDDITIAVLKNMHLISK